MAAALWWCVHPGGHARTGFYEFALFLPWGVLFALLSLFTSPIRMERRLAIAYFALLALCAVRFWLLPHHALDIARNMTDPLIRQSQFIGCGAVGWLLVRAFVMSIRREELVRPAARSLACFLAGAVLYAALVASSALCLRGSNVTWLSDDYGRWIPQWIFDDAGLIFILGLASILLPLPAALLVCLVYRIPVVHVSVGRKTTEGEPIVR